MNMITSKMIRPSSFMMSGGEGNHGNTSNQDTKIGGEKERDTNTMKDDEWKRVHSGEARRDKEQED